MGIFRGTGGTGDSTTDTTVTTVTEKAAEAASSATSAANSATSAANSASSASTSEANAATSESNAATSATASATSATASETAKTASQAAQTAAETAEANAETAEANAVTAKNQAESARDNAQTAQTAAETAETNAETAYADTLAIYGSTTDVQNAVNSASASATTATTKAAEAATSATNAANSATSAGTSETNAASSASQAATSANTAGSHATDAETAKNAAETAQAAAEAAEANINGLYLGSLADDPTLDGNGLAVGTGDLYFNTTENEVRVYTDNDEWIAVIEAGGDATFNSLTSNNDVVVKGNLEVQGTTITVDSATAQTIDLGDNDKIRFGDGDDLQIYHDGTDSYIANTTGTLKLSGNTDVTGNITVSGTVDGRDIAADGTTLDAVASTYVDVSGDTLTGDLAFGDNVKAKFGAGNDLEIYHDGSNTFINDQGTGDLIIVADNLRLRGTNGEQYILGNANAEVQIRYDGVTKFQTTSSGVDITGTVVADKFEATSTSFLESTNLQLSAGFPRLILLENDTTNLNSRISHQNGALRIETLNDAGTTATKRLDIDHSTGDISFYEDTGTTAKLTWDASAEELQFKDSVKAEFGDGGDLQIYHNGTASFIDDGGSGDLNIRANNLGLRNISGAYYIYCTSGGGVEMRHNNAVKFTTTSTGIDVTGTVTADSLTVDQSGIGTIGNVELKTISSFDTSNALPSIGRSTASIGGSGTGTLVIQGRSDLPRSVIIATGDTSTARFHENGDISFYDDAGTSQDFYWDASTSRLGLGTTSPNRVCHVEGTKQSFGSTNSVLQLADDTAMAANVGGGLTFTGKASTGQSDSNTVFGAIHAAKDNSTSGNTSGHMIFSTRSNGSNPAERMRIDSSGRLGIGTTSPIGNLTINSDTGGDARGLYLTQTSSDRASLTYTNTSGELKLNNTTAGFTSFYNNGSEAMRIDSSGRVGIGTTSPATKLQINDSTTAGVGTSSGSYDEHLRIYGNNGNVGHISQYTVRDSTGTSWTSSGSRLQMRIDSTYMGWMQFNGSGNTQGISFGTGSSTSSPLSVSEKMRIDSSGNLLVGGTTSGATSAHTFYSYGLAQHRRDSGHAVILDRLTDDGAIATFRKDGTTIGSIGVDNSDNLVIEGNSTHSGLQFGTATIMPHQNGAVIDNTVDLGYFSHRFKNLYLSGGVYLGGTGSANLLDDYEEGTWTPTYEPETGSFTTMDVQVVDADYVKIGSRVWVTCWIRTNDVDTTGASGLLYVSGLPFSASGYFSVNIGHASNFSGEHPLEGILNTGDSRFLLRYRSTVTSGSSNSSVSDLSTGTNANHNQIRLHILYTTAS